jgi:hypothetical protein
LVFRLEVARLADVVAVAEGGQDVEAAGVKRVLVGECGGRI